MYNVIIIIIWLTIIASILNLYEVWCLQNVVKKKNKNIFTYLFW